MEQQIKKYQAGEDVVAEEDPFSGGIDLSQIDPTALMNLLNTSRAQANEKRTDPRSFLKSRTAPSEAAVQEYDRGLTQMYGANRPSSIYDLASSVGASMLAADPAAGAFRSMGSGFARYGLEEAERRKKMDAERRAIAMKAFELAKSDEDAANDLINQYAIEVAKRDPDNEFTSYYVTDEAGITVDGVYYDRGSFASLTNSEARQFRGQLTRATATGVKVPGMGALARYSTREDAERQVKSLGLTPNMPAFERAVNRITASSPERIGEDIIQAGVFMELRPLVQNGVIIDILLGPAAGAGTPAFEIVRKNRLSAIAKSQDGYNDKLLNVIPAVDRAMTQLMAGISTGGLVDLTLGFRQLVTQTFGISDPALSGVEDIMGISNYLAPKMRPVGSGSTSDMEFKAYQNAILSLGKTPEANYISLYAFKKMTENGIRNNNAELELLSDTGTTSQKFVNAELRKGDRGIFERLPDTIDKTNDEAILEWYKSLPNGSVIDNSQGIFDGGSPYVITGWVKKGVYN
tara:strand:+ start:101 stop:1657 length:1557 start_codon:yes stop_codon:yes gene_type:complete